MKKLILSLAAILMSCATMLAGHYDNENPVANPNATVVCGNARFTVLTPELIRMEWSADGKFEDNKTLTFVNRNLPVPKFTKSVNKSGATIKTDALTLRYRNNGQPFDAKNLDISLKVNGKNVKWTPGMDNPGNLKGTTRTLDRAYGYKFRKGSEMEDGLISRDGWVVVDDSSNILLTPDDSHWEEWVKTRSEGERQDLYFFGYGHNYKKALNDYQKVAGKAMLPPKYTLGYWWSRYWQYSDDEFQDIIGKLRSYDIPVDVLIVDMDWHDTFGLRRNNTKKDEYDQRIGWTGYTWQKELFPSPKNFLEWTDRENLKTALNLHPASGIQPYEEVYDTFTKEYGWNQPGKSVPFKIDEKKWADTYFDVVLSPMEDMGVDFWWLDWQQWLESKYTPGLSNTFWLNHTFFHHARENAAEADGLNKRPFIYHRWGGLGSHRYPLGFSGDTYTAWETLAFLPWFTATASNVNYGYWGHDIGGHLFKDDLKETDPELYLRWLQYGVFTPIFKTHSTKDNRIVRYPWAFPDHQFQMRDAIQLRYALVPYIYNAARENYDTGIGMCRPMYYEYPETDKAYNVPEQFFFGPDIIATAVATPIDSVTGLAPRTMWFPEGEWFDMASGNVYGPGEYELTYTLEENPYFVRSGAIIPMNPKNVRSIQAPCDTLVFTFIPGAEGTLRHYEDDGDTEEYLQKYAITPVSRSLDGNDIKVKIGKREGTYNAARDSRSYELRFPATMPPAKVIVDGKEYQYARFPKPGTWTYDGISLQPVIYTEAMPLNKDIDVTLEYGDTAPYSAALQGKQGLFRRFRQLTPEFKEEQCNNGESMEMLPEGYLKASQCANFIQENPAGIATYLRNFDEAIKGLPEVMKQHKYSSEGFKNRVLRQAGE